MLTRILIFLFFCCGSAAAEGSLQGGWQLIGVASQQEMPELLGDLKLFIYPNEQAVLQIGKSGNYEIIPASWQHSKDQKLEIKSEKNTFSWDIQLLEANNLVVFDQKDQATITFQRIPQNNQWKAQDLNANWVLIERAGKVLAPEDPKTPKLLLQKQAKALLYHWPSKDSLARWNYLPEGSFLQLQNDSITQYYEILYISEDYMVFRDFMLIYIFQKQDTKVPNFRQAERKLYGHWQAISPQYPVEKAELIFRKDATLNAISNLNTSLKRWEMSKDQQFLHLHPYQKESTEKSELVRVRFLDKNHIILSDEEMTVIFQKMD
jgi:hypothetical protein